MERLGATYMSLEEIERFLLRSGGEEVALPIDLLALRDPLRRNVLSFKVSTPNDSEYFVFLPVPLLDERVDSVIAVRILLPLAQEIVSDSEAFKRYAADGNYWELTDEDLKVGKLEAGKAAHFQRGLKIPCVSGIRVGHVAPLVPMPSLRLFGEGCSFTPSLLF